MRSPGTGRLRHLAYAGGWKKFEPLWDWVIRLQRVSNFLPLLEAILGGVGKKSVRTELDEVFTPMTTEHQQTHNVEN